MYIIISGKIVDGIVYQVIGGAINYMGHIYGACYFTGSTSTTYTVVGGSPLVYEASEFLGAGFEIQSDFYLGLFSDDSFFEGHGLSFENINVAEKEFLAPDLIEIFFKSDIDFTGNGSIIRFDDWQVLRKRGEVVKKNIQPFTLNDNVNGDDVSVLKKIWDGYILEIFINESQANILSIIQACPDILIKDNKNGTIFIADNSNSNFLQVEISDFIEKTSNYRATIIFRTNKKTINLKKSINNTYAINIDDVIFYTDIKPIIICEDAKFESIKKDNGVELVVSSASKKILKYTFYLDEEKKNELKNDYEKSLITYAKYITSEWLVGLEKRIVKIDMLADDFYRCVVNFVFESDIIYN